MRGLVYCLELSHMKKNGTQSVPFTFQRKRKTALRLEALVSFLKRSDASCANVAVRFLAVFNVGNLLNVHFESSSRFTVGVAYVVARRLTFTANIAYSRHIDTSDLGIIFAVVYP